MKRILNSAIIIGVLLCGALQLSAGEKTENQNTPKDQAPAISLSITYKVAKQKHMGIRYSSIKNLRNDDYVPWMMDKGDVFGKKVVRIDQPKETDIVEVVLFFTNKGEQEERIDINDVFVENNKERILPWECLPGNAFDSFAELAKYLYLSEKELESADDLIATFNLEDDLKWKGRFYTSLKPKQQAWAAFIFFLPKKMENAVIHFGSADWSTLNLSLRQESKQSQKTKTPIEADLDKRMQLYRQKKAKPKFVLTFEQLGPRWKTWPKQVTKGSLGYYCKKKATSIEVGFLPMGSKEIIMENGFSYTQWMLTDEQAQTTVLKSLLGEKISDFYNLALGRMNLTTEIVTSLHGRAPTGDGSIIAFKTDGLKMVWLNFIIFVSEEEETLYFGVIDSLGGLVHLAGKGKCIIGFGEETKETILK